MISGMWKTLGIILSVLWLLATGGYLGLVFVFSGEAPGLQKLGILLSHVLAYIVFGLGPVLGFILLMKRYDDPIGYAALTVLAMCTASPIVVIPLYLLP